MPTPTLRPQTEEDQPFLLVLFASTRAAELADAGWSDEHKAAFLRMQFEAQRASYAQRFPDACCDIIVLDGRPIGRICIDRTGATVHLVDIAILPSHRCMGIGTAVLEDVLASARLEGRPITMHVERSNRALSLYRRMGFEVRADRGLYLLLELAPEGLRGLPRSAPDPDGGPASPEQLS